MWLISLLGLYSLFTIPKESSPDIDFGIISINTIYIGVNPIDIDSLITTEIEKEIKDIEWIKKLTSRSVLGVSSITAELENEADVTQVLVDIKDAVDKVDLPTEAEDPIVTELSSDNEVMFTAVLSADSSRYSMDYLKEKATKIQSQLEWKWAITTIDVEWWVDYEIEILVDKWQVETLWISISQISQTIRSFNRNQPLGNYEIGSLSYDFRINGELDSLQELLDIPLQTRDGAISLSDIAEAQITYDDERITRMGSFGNQWNTYVSLTFNKKPGENIFAASTTTKESLDAILSTEEFADIDVAYTLDLSDVIRDDYASLAKNWLTTVILVFLSMLFFVGLKESLIASITIPLAFFITFFVLNQLWLSLNFLTNFSLIVTFWIAIDTTIVVIEWAHEKMRMWYSWRSAVLLAVRDYKRPLITWTTTTCVVFLPMISLPGITWKFLAYIPITIFITLIAALFISLTVNSALYYALSKPSKKFEDNPEESTYMSEEEFALLTADRKGKQPLASHNKSWREKMLDTIGTNYSTLLGRIMRSKKTRLAGIFLPVVALIFSFVIFAPWFTLFPSGDNPNLFVTILAKEWTSTSITAQDIGKIDDVFVAIPEIETYFYSINNNQVNVTIELFKETERARGCWLFGNTKNNGKSYKNLPPEEVLKKREAGKLCMRDSFAVEEEIAQWLAYLETNGLRVETQVQAWWPPAGSAVWLKLIADSTEQLPALIQIAKEFEEKLRTIPWAKNISNSSDDTPGQFIFEFDEDKLRLLGLTPNDFSNELFATMQWVGAGALKGRYDDYDIKVLYKQFETTISPSDVQNIRVNTTAGVIRVGDVIDYTIENSISSVQREDTNLLIKVDADTEQWLTPDKVQIPFAAYAASYDFPDGIRYEQWGETSENADLIQATFVAFGIALLLIYLVLVLQFNSYMQPAIIMYSVVLWLLWANIWLRATNNPYSMAFAIGFIALTWIVVNDAIVFIDRINKNLRKWMELIHAITDAGKARVQPIILTTITTVLWLRSVAREDAFFAGLAYTIMFGLFVWSAATLFVIPAIYHDKDKLIIIFKRTIMSLIVFVLPPIAIIWLLIVFAYLFGLPLTSIVWSVWWIVVVWYVVWYIIHLFRARVRGNQTLVEKLVRVRVQKIWSSNDSMPRKQAIKRFMVKWWLLVGPIITWLVLSNIPSVSVIWTIVMSLGIAFVVIGNIISIWLSDSYETLHDRIVGTKVLQYPSPMDLSEDE